MRKLVVTEFVSLDGVMEAPAGDDGYVHGAWTMPYWGDEGDALGEYKTAELFAADALLLGRVTYQGFAAAWPKRSGDGDPFTDRMNSIAKYVVSNTLDQADWDNTTILTGDMATAVRELKDQQGADILVYGSATLAQGLLEADLVDELRLEIYPLTLGVGKRLFSTGTRLDFQVADSKQTSKGVMLVTYRRTER
jgi:dihydrofolate reductase